MTAHRRPTRLTQYDYRSPGAYFVTICTHERRCTLGEVVQGEFVPSLAGEIVASCWEGLPDHYPAVSLDAFVVMPNHLHGVVFLKDFVGAALSAALVPVPPPTDRIRPLSEVVRALKAFSAREINVLNGRPGAPVWQRGYYEHVIRQERDLQDIRAYMADNPRRWSEDRENPAWGLHSQPVLGRGRH